LYAQMLISLREAFEAALLIVIVASYLKRIGRPRLIYPLILGGFVGVIASIATGVIAYQTYVFVEEKALAEAVGAFIAVPILTSVIYWMAVKGRDIKASVEEKVGEAVSSKSVFSISLLGLVFVYREGFETVLFILPLLFKEPINTFIGVVIGVLGSLIISYGIFKMGVKMNIRLFFYFTSILLIFVASGILGYGIHELFEYTEEIGLNLSPWSGYVYRLPIDSTNIFHEKGLIGGLLSVLFGYATKMELGRLIAQGAYLLIGLGLVFKAYRTR